MIAYLATAQHTYTMANYLRTWGRALADTIEVLSYDDVLAAGEVSAGTVVFTDLERLSAAGDAAAAQIATQLGDADAHVRVLNAPQRVLRRQALLEALAGAGLNEFRSHRLTETRTPRRFPVFLRDANEHEHFTELLHSQEELDRAIADVLDDGRPVADLLMVEFCDVSDVTGLYRKYSAFRVGDRILPRHLIFSRSWVLKEPDLIDDEKLEEEARYLDANPHRDELLQVFELAGIDYGRIDYGVKDGRVQVWEINTNPIVMLLPEQYNPVHLPAQELFAPQVEAAFRAIDTKGPVRRIPIAFDSGVRARLERERALYAAWDALTPPQTAPS